MLDKNGEVVNEGDRHRLLVGMILRLRVCRYIVTFSGLVNGSERVMDGRRRKWVTRWESSGMLKLNGVVGR